jgi:predicted permease
VSTISGVDAAAGVTNLPLTSNLGDLNFRIEGRPIPEGAVSPRGDWQVITPGYFDVMGMTLLQGRGIEARDDATAPGAVVVSESLARMHWPEGDAMGKRFVLGGGAGPGWVTIVGIVRDVRHSGLDASLTPQYYLAHEQFTFWSGGSAVNGLSIVVRSAVPTAALRTAIQGVAGSMDPQLPLSSFRMMDEVRSASVAQPRLLMGLLGGFSVLALVLAAVGTYGVIAHMAGRRTAEFGVRIALGARPGQVSRLVLGEAMRLGAVGIGVGILATVALTRVMEGLLYGVSARDPMTLLASASILGATGLLAAYLPARRATRVDAVESLRAD